MLDLLSKVSVVKDWVLARWAERTTWDGTVLIAVGVVGLIASPLVKLASWVAIGYGAWTLWKKEK
jgi:hypothetical protein